MTPDARRQPSAGMRRHEVADRPRLVHQRPALLEQPAVQVAVGEEPDERARLPADVPESLAPGQRQHAGGNHGEEEREEQRHHFMASTIELWWLATASTGPVAGMRSRPTTSVRRWKRWRSRRMAVRTSW